MVFEDIRDWVEEKVDEINRHPDETKTGSSYRKKE